MPNSVRDLKKRLLHLFPVKTLKETFEQAGNAADVIEIISAKNLTDLVDFATSNYTITRQNIHLFDLDANFTRGSIGADFPLTIEKETLSRGTYTFCCLPKTTFSVYLSDPMDKEDLVFYQPVFIICNRTSLRIHFTKLEKNVNAYYPDDRQAKRAGVSNAHEAILRSILQYFAAHYTVTITDFNKGLKAIWAGDDIDCHKIQSQNTHSVRLETMNGEMTYKEKYPAEYAKVILTSLDSAQWKYLKDDEYLCEGFTADPSAGTISITKFPKNNNQVSNVISKILAGN